MMTPCWQAVVLVINTDTVWVYTASEPTELERKQREFLFYGNQNTHFWLFQCKHQTKIKWVSCRIFSHSAFGTGIIPQLWTEVSLHKVVILWATTCCNARKENAAYHGADICEGLIKTLKMAELKMEPVNWKQQLSDVSFKLSCLIRDTEGSKTFSPLIPPLENQRKSFRTSQSLLLWRKQRRSVNIPLRIIIFKKKGWVMDQTHTFGQIPHKFPPIRFVNLINSWQQMSSQLKSVSKKNGWEEWRGAF